MGLNKLTTDKVWSKSSIFHVNDSQVDRVSFSIINIGICDVECLNNE